MYDLLMAEIRQIVDRYWRSNSGSKVGPHESFKAGRGKKNDVDVFERPTDILAAERLLSGSRLITKQGTLLRTRIREGKEYLLWH